MDIQEAMDKARERSTWRLLVGASSSGTPDGGENWNWSLANQCILSYI